jgi:hypothetical protein
VVVVSVEAVEIFERFVNGRMLAEIASFSVPSSLPVTVPPSIRPNLSLVVPHRLRPHRPPMCRTTRRERQAADNAVVIFVVVISTSLPLLALLSTSTGRRASVLNTVVVMVCVGNAADRRLCSARFTARFAAWFAARFAA